MEDVIIGRVVNQWIDCNTFCQRSQVTHEFLLLARRAIARELTNPFSPEPID
jgi:hypothetical protein